MRSNERFFRSNLVSNYVFTRLLIGENMKSNIQYYSMLFLAYDFVMITALISAGIALSAQEYITFGITVLIGAYAHWKLILMIKKKYDYIDPDGDLEKTLDPKYL